MHTTETKDSLPQLRLALVAEFTRFLADEHIIFRQEELRPFESDGLTLFQSIPLIVVLPSSEEELQKVVAVCHSYGVPIVARGAGTGLSGGALPAANGVLISTARMNKILQVDPVARTAKVEPGVSNLAISQAVIAHDLFYAPDPSSQIACTIGGNVAENAGGVHCLKYGLTLHNLVGLRLVTIEGEAFSIGGAFDDAGYDLLALLTGSEGMLAFITEVTVKLSPRPAATTLVLAAFESVSDAASSVARILASGIIPAGLEMMDHGAISAVEPFVNAGYPLDAQAILLCELDGAMLRVDHDCELVCRLLKASGAVSVKIAADPAERALWWAGRKAAFPAAGRLSPDYYCMDGTIPRRHLSNVLGRIADLSAKFGLRCFNVFHAGDGNLHPLILFDASQSDQTKRAEAFGAAILDLCLEAGGTITGEHGVGVEKLDSMCTQFGRSEIACFHGIKHAFDPGNKLNPGKAIPTLNRCAEFGAMKVHANRIAHPNLPRF